MSEGPKKRNLREQAKISLRALAREMGISAPYLLDLERGWRPWNEGMQQKHASALTALTKKNPALAKT